MRILLPLAGGAKLVGRHAELAGLHQALDALNIPTCASCRSPGAWSGKTRLLAELCDRAESGVACAGGPGTEFEPDLPFGMFHACPGRRPRFRSASRSWMSPIGARCRAGVRISLLVCSTPRPAPLPEERYRAYRTSGGAGALSASDPSCCLDDIHWAGPGIRRAPLLPAATPPGVRLLPLPSRPLTAPAAETWPRPPPPGREGRSASSCAPYGRGGTALFGAAIDRRAGGDLTGRAAATPSTGGAGQASDKAPRLSVRAGFPEEGLSRRR